jgi:uncharacterized membrane protein
MMKKNDLRLDLILALIGLIISIYLTAYHFLQFPLYCNNNSIINCSNVLNSRYATIFGISIAEAGIIFFAVELLLIWIKKTEYMFYWNFIGILSVVMFLYIEYIIGQICEYCTAVHIIVVTLFIISIWRIKK